MDKDISLKVKKQLHELQSMIRDSLKNDILPDRTYTQIITQIGLIETSCMGNEFKLSDQAYYDWVKSHLEKITGALVSLKKHSSTAFSIPNEDLMHVTGDYYNEDNSISLTNDVKHTITAIINETYSP